MLHRGFWHQVMTGSRGARELHDAVNSNSTEVKLHLVGDAHTVLTAITAEEIAVPNDRSQLHAARAMRDPLDCGSLICLIRCDTRDLCDVLTKGAVARGAVVEAFGTGEWRMLIKGQNHVWPEPSRDAAG